MSTTTPFAAAYEALLGLLAVALTVPVILCCVHSGIQAGDGSNAELAEIIRAHANFAEQVPLALLLILLAEMAGARAGPIHVLRSGLLIARLASAWGFRRWVPDASPGQRRYYGAVATALVITGASLWIAYRLPVAH